VGAARPGVDDYFDARDLPLWTGQLASGEIDGFRLVIDSTGTVSAETSDP